MKNKEVNENKFMNFVEKNKKAIIVVVAVVVILAGAAGGYTLSVKNKVQQWENKIYTGVQAYGIDLSGKTKEEATEIISNELLQQFTDKKIIVKVGDESFELSYGDIDLAIDVEATVDEAYNYGKDGSMFNKNSLISKGKVYSVTTQLSYDEDKIKEFANEVNDSVKIDATDAQITISNSGSISITPEKTGMEIDVDNLVSKIKDTITPDQEETVEIAIELEEYESNVTAEALGTIDGVLGTYTSTFSNTGDGRSVNVALATEFCNGTVVMPGEEFSYNQTIGETTAERGYQEANTYVGSEVVPGYGGGVCQVSTALYRAVMRSNIKSTVRYNHSMMVSYADASLDATVAEGDIDYRFVNTYDYPVYIQGIISGNSIIFNVYGHVDCLEGMTYELVNEVTETINYSTEYIEDSTLAKGKEVVKMNGSNGCKSKGYLVAYKDGKEVSRELVSTDYYAPLNKVVRKGTKTSS